MKTSCTVNVALEGDEQVDVALADETHRVTKIVAFIGPAAGFDDVPDVSVLGVRVYGNGTTTKEPKPILGAMRTLLADEKATAFRQALDAITQAHRALCAVEADTPTAAKKTAPAKATAAEPVVAEQP